MADVEKVNPYRNDDRRKDEQVQSMFDTIAPAYDFMNHAMTGFLDRRWARKLVDEAVKTEPTIARCRKRPESNSDRR